LQNIETVFGVTVQYDHRIGIADLVNTSGVYKLAASWIVCMMMFRGRANEPFRTTSLGPIFAGFTTLAQSTVHNFLPNQLCVLPGPCAVFVQAFVAQRRV
jgi:hypothetical protein